MTTDDVTALADSILERRKASWISALREQARIHGCTSASPSAPRLGDLDMLKRMSAEDAKSIAATYNRELANKINALYRENPRGNRTFYFSRLEAWSTKRAAWKSPQIALTTEMQTRAYAMERFRAMNFDKPLRYIFAGPAPTCRVCVKLFAEGVVDEAFMRSTPIPVHPNCPHYFRVVRPPKLECNQLWLG